MEKTMNKLIEFLKSLLLPRKMIRFRSMSVLITICIMLLVASSISVPPVKVFQKNKYEYIDKYDYIYLKSLKDYESSSLDATEFSNEISELNLEVVQKDSENNNSYYLKAPTMNYGDKKEWLLEYQKDEKNIHIKFVVDYYDPTISENALNHQNLITNEFEKEDSVYKSDDNNTYFLVAICTDTIIYGYSYYQTETTTKRGCSGEEVKTDANASFQKLALNYNKNYKLSLIDIAANPSKICEKIAYFIMDGYTEAYIWMIQLQIYIIVPLFTLLFTVLFFMCFKRNGNLKRFKEFFNIAGISMIVPCIVFFIVAWFIPSVTDYYMYGFAIYYVFSLSRINSMQNFI